jgi:hypothetical protein
MTVPKGEILQIKTKEPRNGSEKDH